MSETQETPTQSGPTLGIDDIKNAVRIIDFAADQGAFKGWTVTEQVLLVRNRLNNFIKSVAPDETPATPEATVTDTTVNTGAAE
jgi:hypothetical protein